jgi:hypothetical protein
MATPEVIKILFEVVLIPLLGTLTIFIIKFLNAKSKDLQAKIDNDIADKYIAMIAATVEQCVIATNQTYVESLKSMGRFDAEAQKIAFERTLNAVLSILSDEAKDYIFEATGDVSAYLTNLIEASVNANK